MWRRSWGVIVGKVSSAAWHFATAGPVVLLAPHGAERLAYALRSAALKARELAAFIARATTGEIE